MVADEANDDAKKKKKQLSVAAIQAQLFLVNLGVMPSINMAL